jgi:predicted 2-oxoglutarate/Fe(II)-dependent dioxygenase YbiX
MSPHDDGNGQPVKHGIVIYLSNPEDYVGWEIYYPKLDIELKPKRGSIVIHPREDDYTHGVKPVMGGFRFVMVMFTG